MLAWGKVRVNLCVPFNNNFIRFMCAEVATSQQCGEFTNFMDN